ncbi:MAG: aminoglycoside phosphotransferase family protein [bacterium]
MFNFFRRHRRLERAELKTRIEEYCRRWLRERLGAAPDADLSFLPMTKGHNTLLRGVAVEGIGPLVLRFFPLRRDLRTHAAEHETVHRLLLELGLPVAPFYFRDNSPDTLKFLAAEVTAEKFLEGRNLTIHDVANPAAPQFEPLLDLVASLHQRVSNSFGRPLRAADDSYSPAEWYARRAAHCLARLRQDRYLSASEADGWETFFASKSSILSQRPHFSLIHGDLQSANLIVDPKGKLWIIDFGTVRYEHFAIDLLQLQSGLFARVPETFKTFLDCYLKKRGGALRRSFDADGPFLAAFLTLEKAYSHCAKANKVQRGKRREYGDTETSHRHAATKLLNRVRTLVR